MSLDGGKTLVLVNISVPAGKEHIPSMYYGKTIRTIFFLARLDHQVDTFLC